jgi:hypothetical protein
LVKNSTTVETKTFCPINDLIKSVKKLITFESLFIDGNEEEFSNFGIVSVKVLAAAILPNIFFFLVI